MRVDDNQLTGVSTDFFGPVQAFASIAGGGNSYFDLKFFEKVTENVQLFRSCFTQSAAGTRLAPTTPSLEDCGVSATQPTMVFAPVPEPGSFALCLGGLVTGWMVRRRRR